MGKLRFLFRYLHHYFTAGTEHGLHSPFVYELYSQTIRPKKIYYPFHAIEKLRKELLRSSETIQVVDYGAGSQVERGSLRPISSIARHSEKSPVLAQLIFKLVDHFQPAVVLDLGTSLGITTLYESFAREQATIYTFEGCPNTARIALRNFHRLKRKNINLIEGNIDNTLPALLPKISKIDFVFFDANHRFEPTINYFNICLSKAHEYSVFIFDDIHWSEEMEQAWEKIKADERVTLTIDLFYIGLVFFRKKQPKQDFKLKV
ncbi:MAG: O-methyltransferase [Cytophagaceae bacterium]